MPQDYQKPRCEHCGYLVTVVRESARFVAWCGCEATAPSDPHHRGVGGGGNRGRGCAGLVKSEAVNGRQTVERLKLRRRRTGRDAPASTSREAVQPTV